MAQMDHVDHQSQSFNHPLVISSGDKYTQLESVNPQQIIHRDAIQLNQFHQTTPAKISSSCDSESSEEDEIEEDEEDDDDENSEDADDDEHVVGGGNEPDDDEYGDDDDDDEEDDDDEDDDDADEDDDDDADDDDEETSQDQDCDDIVDPVGHYMHHQGNNNCNGQTIINGTYQAAIINNNDESNSDGEDDDDDDVSFENEPDDATIQDSSASELSLNSERMLEVTRKLVRSTERDPDRDLRKQVLLRTAIRRLPHFMDSQCSHYSNSFDQNFRLHNNTMSENNSTTLECLSPSQYYENHNIYHLEPTQPKSYYHSVQPNAIQMSTTSLRMLDLNDDQESEIVVQPPVTESAVTDSSSTTTITSKHPNLVSFEINENHHVTQTTTSSLEQHQQHEYSDSNIYNTYHHHHLHQQQQDQTLNCLDAGSSSSQSSTSSDDSVNSSTHSNDSADDSNGISILETSLNATNDYHYRSHDSGVALFSPKSNKRTSSSIGLYDEMDIDHLSSDYHLSDSNQVFTGSVANHCKRLRKKEIID
jgi:hypothetical protein